MNVSAMVEQQLYRLRMAVPCGNTERKIIHRMHIGPGFEQRPCRPYTPIQGCQPQGIVVLCVNIGTRRDQHPHFFQASTFGGPEQSMPFAKVCGGTSENRDKTAAILVKRIIRLIELVLHTDLQDSDATVGKAL
jgi:hypothetical protein